MTDLCAKYVKYVNLAGRYLVLILKAFIKEYFEIPQHVLGLFSTGGSMLLLLMHWSQSDCSELVLLLTGGTIINSCVGMLTVSSKIK